MIMSNEVKVFKSCKMTTINKSDMPQVVPPEFSIRDFIPWNNNAIKEARAIGGDTYDG